MATLLLASDLHLGRVSTRLGGYDLGKEGWAATAWERLVKLSVQRRAAAVCLAGDVVDQENYYWEALGLLERGIAQLAAAGIVTVAVAGNHDVRVLADLADSLPAEQAPFFRLLGRGGRWEEFSLTDHDQPVLRLHGWSFPEQTVTRSPLDSYHLSATGHVPVLGMVHGDLDQPGSPYAPLDRRALRRLPPAGWLLGHQHRPLLETAPGASWLLYPGSLQALDPGEPGPHGAWLLEVNGRALSTPQPLPLSSVRYRKVAVDLTACQDAGAVRSLLLERLREIQQRAAREGGAFLRLVRVRLELTGRSPAATAVPAVVDGIRDLLLKGHEGPALSVEKVTTSVLPPLDLLALATGATATADLARLLLALREGTLDADQTDLLQRVTAAIRRELSVSEYADIGASLPDEDAARDLLATAAERLLLRLQEAAS